MTWRESKSWATNRTHVATMGGGVGWGWVVLACAIFGWLLPGGSVLPAEAHGQLVEEFEPAGAGLPLYRPEGGVAVLAVALPTWVAVPTDPHDLLGEYAFLPPFATDDTEGQLFHLLDSEDGGSVADGEGRFVVVPWTVGCGCAEEGWDRPDWVPPGDTVAFLLTRTRERVPWSGPPVFDVKGWHQPYPTGDFVPFWRDDPAQPSTWIGAVDFFELLKALPSQGTFVLDPSASREGVEGWLRGRPELASAFPVSTLLRALDRIDPEG